MWSRKISYWKPIRLKHLNIIHKSPGIFYSLSKRPEEIFLWKLKALCILSFPFSVFPPLAFGTKTLILLSFLANFTQAQGVVCARYTVEKITNREREKIRKARKGIKQNWFSNLKTFQLFFVEQKKNHEWDPFLFQMCSLTGFEDITELSFSSNRMLTTWMEKEEKKEASGTWHTITTIENHTNVRGKREKRNLLQIKQENDWKCGSGLA